MRYVRIKTIVFFLCGFFFLFKTPVKAVTVSIPQYPSVITQDIFSVTASISGATNGTNYVRIDIYKDGSTNYFGETYNGTDWYSGSDYHQYLAVPIVGGQWSGIIQGSLGSPSSSEYDGTGIYRMRIRRYTGGGTTNATEADSSSVAIQIVTPSPTPAPTNTPTPTSTPLPTPTPKPTVTPLPTPTQKITQGVSPLISEVFALAADSGSATDDSDLLADDEIPIASISPIVKTKVTSMHKSLFPGIFLGIGGVIIIGCGILFVYKHNKHDADSTNA